MLNIIWSGFFVVAAVFAGIEFFGGNTEVWNALTAALFDSAKSGFTVALNLTGMLCFWLGLMKIAEKSGLTQLLSKALAPLFYKIMAFAKKKKE